MGGIEGAQLEAIITCALSEDVSDGDPTTEVLIPKDLIGKAVIMAKVEGVLAGVKVAAAVFQKVDPSLVVNVIFEDGSELANGSIVLKIEGSLASILKAERTALNFIQRLSGIASLTRCYVDSVVGTRANILDTRKTTPGLRLLEKYAVRIGGGQNHRSSLSESVLIKDNHIAACKARGLTLNEIVLQAREHISGRLKVEVEVDTVEDLDEVLDAGADIILLDNMDSDSLRKAVEMVSGKAVLEASGGITLATVRSIAETGVDLISVGALTHSVSALDLSLEVV